MSATTCFSLRPAGLAIFLLTLSNATSAQSGRGWMEGMAPGVSDRPGIRGAVVTGSIIITEKGKSDLDGPLDGKSFYGSWRLSTSYEDRRTLTVTGNSTSPYYSGVIGGAAEHAAADLDVSITTVNNERYRCDVTATNVYCGSMQPLTPSMDGGSRRYDLSIPAETVQKDNSVHVRVFPDGQYDIKIYIGSQKQVGTFITTQDKFVGGDAAGASCAIRTVRKSGAFKGENRFLANDMIVKGVLDPSNPSVLNGSQLLKGYFVPAKGADPDSCPKGRPGTETTIAVSWELAIALQPAGPLPKVDLVVDSQSYETWRPEARMDEDTIGNDIRFDAKLQDPGGSPAKVKARKMIFELIGTSREPGVALNFPLAAASPGKFDLQFSPTSNPPGRYIINGLGRQQAETVQGHYTSASAVVSSFDWGGWSTLRVTAELEDGRRVIGHFRSKSGPTGILLPKRSTDSKIADSWKQQAGVSLPDDDDSETGPAGAGSPGDGFSLYEEYRGFYVDGQHVAGDPKKIDFFVRNHIGVDAEPGIFLFTDLTGAEVHSKLLDTEFDRQKRVMNANHGQGPHLVDQHGVILETQPGLDGGLTELSKADVRGRPAITLSVNLQPRDSLTSMVTSENVPVSDLAFAYDRAVAHELLHSVGADHHGKGDGQETFFFVFGDDPENQTGKSHFRYSFAEGHGRGLEHLGEEEPVSIIDEATGRDLASIVEGDMMLERESLRPSFYPGFLQDAVPYVAGRQGMNVPYPWTAEQTAEHWLNRVVDAKSFFIGAEHGQCSGNELCVMRYYFARLYKKRGTTNAFYYIGDSRSERAGLELCRLPTGTGINDKDRRPQPRYGGAAATRGACATSIIFNDALPLKSDAIPEEPTP